MATVPIYSSPESRQLTHQNTNHGASVTSSSEDITIRAPPGTNLWRMPSRNDYTAPTLYTKVPISKFKSARVTVSSNWNTIYDQGGLVLFLNNRWVKADIEYVFEQPNVATVATDRWSDWSLAPVPGVGDDYVKGDKVSATLEVEREVLDGKKTSSLLVYKVDPKTRKRQLVRAVTWVFEELNGDLSVGIYAAKPTHTVPEGPRQEELEVNFRDFEIKLFQ